MLTADLIRPRLRQRGMLLTVDMLPAKRAELKTAADLIDLFQQQVGKPLQAWDNALEGYEGERTDYIIVRGLAKVLEDAATFTPLQLPVIPAEVRQQLFVRGPAFSAADLFNTTTRDDVLQAAAEELSLTLEQLELALFADRLAENILTDAPATWTPESLIARYNLELSRGVLYWCDQMQVDVFDGYKDFWRYMKLFKLMFEASARADEGYHVILDGPISPFVKSTTRYGRQFAVFLPALLLGERWNMTASIRLPQSREPLQYRLDNTSPLRTHFKKSGEFDSRLEADFAAEFAEKFGSERGKWTLTREDEVLLLGDTV